MNEPESFPRRTSGHFAGAVARTAAQPEQEATGRRHRAELADSVPEWDLLPPHAVLQRPMRHG
jgi:hypothetical protein